MKYSVFVMPEAERNLDIIYDWIAERSPQGAGNGIELIAMR
jgi:hypothetical protein